MEINDKLKKEIEIKLREIFDEVSKWLTFAEAKNAAMIALNGAMLAGLLNILLNKDFNSYFGIWVKVILFVSIICTIIALGIVLISFLPQLDVFKGRANQSEGNGILIFYGDIAKYKDEKQYIKDIYKYYFDADIDEGQISRIEIDYSREIIMNSSIALKKCRWFKLALLFTISALVTPIPVIIANIIIVVIKKINSI